MSLILTTLASTLATTVAPMLLAAAPGSPGYIRSTPDLGQAEGKCRSGESGPSFLVNVEGLKDRTGKIKLEVYPANDDDFLQDDNLLLMAGKTFRRIVVNTPASGTPNLCVRVPRAGNYAVMVLHDRDSDRKFNWRVDGVGFGSNPKLGWSKPKAAKATIAAGNGPTRISVVMNYQRGLGMKPIR